MKRNFILIFFFLVNTQSVFCQNNIKEYFILPQNENFYGHHDKIVLYEDSTFFIMTNFWMSSGHYSIAKNIINLKSVKNDTNIKFIDIFEMKYKNDLFYTFNQKTFSNYKDLSGIKLIIKNDILFIAEKKRKLFANYFFVSRKMNKKIKTDIKFVLPIKICNKSKIDTSDLFIIKQFYKNNEILNKTVDISKPFSVFDIDSSYIVISPKKLYLYFSPNKQYLSSLDTTVSFPVMFNFKKAPLQYYTIGLWGFKLETLYPVSPVLDKLLKKQYTHDTHKKCTRQLLNSDFFNHKKISFSDSLKINCNETKFNFNGLIFGMGYVYLNELIENYNNSINFVRIKKNPEIFVSKPAFTKNKLLALIKIKDIRKNEVKYLLFERRIRKYQLIAAINEYEIKLINKSLVYFGQYHKSYN